MLHKIQTLTRAFWQWLPVRFRVTAARSTQQKFTVSATAIIVNQEGKVLLLEHVFRPSSGWALPGGFLNAMEQAEEAVIREVREETSLGLENVRAYAARTSRRHIEIFFVANPVGEPRVNSREIMDLKWFKKDELPPDMSRIQRKLIIEVLGHKV